MTKNNVPSKRLRHAVVWFFCPFGWKLFRSSLTFLRFHVEGPQKLVDSCPCSFMGLCASTAKDTTWADERAQQVCFKLRLLLNFLQLRSRQLDLQLAADKKTNDYTKTILFIGGGGELFHLFFFNFLLD